MKKILFLAILSVSFLACIGQSINPADLVGTWDQLSGPRHPTIIFLDSVTLRYSYKGHSGTSKTYYYLIDNRSLPSVLTVDYKKDHRKHRNEYLIQMIDKDTLELQVLDKKSDRSHFDNSHPDKIVDLTRRK